MGELNLQATKGEEFTLPTARVYDVLDPNAKLFVMVTQGDTVIADRVEYYDGMALTFDAYGKYNVNFIAVDNNNGEEIEASVLVKVYNRVAPTLEITGKKQKSVKVGETITPAKAVTNGELFVYIVAPDGRIYQVKDNFKTTLRGTYRVVYYARNEYNVSTVDSYVVVSQ